MRLPIQAPGVPPVVLPPTPVVNRVIGPLQPVSDEAVAETSMVKKASDALSMSKVLAGGMAAATSAVFGSYFGTFGTVGGAAAGSVATTLVTRFYQRSLEHTRDLAKARVQSVTGRAEDEPVEEQRTVQLDPERAAPESGGNGHRSVKLLVSGTLVIFLIGLALVTGIEWAKGSPLSGGTSGTSVGRIVDPHPLPKPKPTPVPSDHERSSSESSRDSDDEDSDRSSDESSKHDKKHLEDILPSNSDQPDPSDSTSPSAPPSSQPGLLPGLGKRQSEGGGLFQQPSSTEQAPAQ